MHPALQPILPALAPLCIRHGVRSLWLFGSAASGRAFDPAQSDLDFIVEFRDADLGPWMRRFFEFQDALQGLFGRPVDLVLAGSIQNRYFAEAVQATRVPLYAAA
jgi:predicted nucleotidyltransferase